MLRTMFHVIVEQGRVNPFFNATCTYNSPASSFISSMFLVLGISSLRFACFWFRRFPIASSGRTFKIYNHYYLCPPLFCITTQPSYRPLYNPLLVVGYADVPFQVLSEFLGECRRLITRVINPESTEPAYLDDNLHEEHSPSPSMLLKRRAQALILFVSTAITSAPSSSPVMTTDVVSPLILLTSIKDSAVEDVMQTAMLSLNRILSVVAVVDFIQAVLNMLQTGDVKVVCDHMLDDVFIFFRFKLVLLSSLVNVCLEWSKRPAKTSLLSSRTYWKPCVR